MTHKDLEVWKKSMDLVEDVYKLMKQLPENEKYGLISQIKRSSISIPSNIAEGAARGSTKEFIRFLDIASGSLSELETQLLLLERLGFCRTEENLREEIETIGKMLYGLRVSLRKKLK
jgi:four helix bundle protein